MTDPRATPDPAGDAADGGPVTGMPRWVRVALIIVLVLALLIVVAKVGGEGDHGPGRHGGDGKQQTMTVA